MKLISTLLISLILVLPADASAFNLEETLQELAAGPAELPEKELATVQRNGMSLSQAVESVRRRGNVERIISASTRVEGNREVHHIRYMTKDGKVKNAKVPGRRRD